jgi:hypothetical protein
LLCVPLLFALSCGNDSSGYHDGDTIFFPDTAGFKRAWNMTEQQMSDELFIADVSYNQLELDTFELTYTPCDCPDWIDQSKLHLECKECSDFYVDPAAPPLLLPEEFLVSGNTVRFYGVRIPGMNLPAQREFKTSDPPAWTVIRYYGYEVIRPYKIRGPQMKIFSAEGDTLRPELTLTILP